MEFLVNVFDRLSNTPNRIILRSQDRELSASQLKNNVFNLCQVLIDKGLDIQDKIGIALPRGVDAAIVIYSVILLGMCYVPLDLANPEDRLEYIISNAHVRSLIGIGEKPNWCKADIEWININSVNLNQIIHPPSIIYRECSSNLLSTILYTSGSTGKPKGVAISRHAINAFAKWAGITFNIKSTDEIASLAPFYFDLSIFDLFTSIHFGASVTFMPQQITFFPLDLSGWLEKNKISVWYTVPSILTYWILKGALKKFNFEHLRLILFAGEKFPIQHLSSLTKLLPKIDLYNLYGPTESNVCCYWKVDSSCLQQAHDIPIGHPPNYAELKLSEDGELLVKGATLASGYVSEDTIVPIVDENGWYHTQDKCSLNEMQEYVFHGRIDRMLKCYGYRIEPGEIENVAYQYPGIKECVVIGIKDGMDNMKPALFYSTANDNSQNNFDVNKFKKFLQSHLVTYMHPVKIIRLDNLPKLSNGKIDLVGMRQLLGSIDNSHRKP